MATLYARMYGGKRLHIVTGSQRAYVARCGTEPGVRGNGYASPGWYSGHAETSPYYPVCKACQALGVTAEREEE